MLQLKQVSSNITKMNEFSQQQSEENQTNNSIKDKLAHQKTYRKIETIVLSLNKSGLSFLTHGQFKQALEHFRKAEKIIHQQIQEVTEHFSEGDIIYVVESEDQQISGNKQNTDDNQSEKLNEKQIKDRQKSASYISKQPTKIISEQQIKSRLINKISKLEAITYNNLACYYKKTNKPKVALGYLKKSLAIQIQKVKDWTSIASTHLNICAIYSYLQAHQEAADHALLAIAMMKKKASQSEHIIQPDRSESHSKTQISQPKNSEQAKSFCNILMLSHYNLAIQYQYMKRYHQSSKQYKIALEIGRKGGKKNSAIAMTCEQAIHRVQNQSLNQRKRLVQLVKKRKINQEKGNYEFMIKNKRHHQNKNAKNLQQNSFEMKIKKFSVYKNYADGKNLTSAQKYYSSNQDLRGNHTSVEKLDRKIKLEPIHNVDLVSKTSNQRMHTNNT